MGEEHLQQGELRTGQLDLPAAPGHLTGRQVHPQIGEAQRLALLGRSAGRRRVRAAAQQRTDPGEQFVQLEGLDEVVVGTGIQTRDTVADRVTGGEHQDRHPHPARPQPAGGGQPVHTGHQDVQHDQFGVVGRDLLDRVQTVDRLLGPVPLEDQRTLQGLPHRGLVVDDQDAGGMVTVLGGAHA